MGELVGVEKFYSFFFFFFGKVEKISSFFFFFFWEKWKSFLLAKTAGSTNLFPTPSLAAPQI